MQSAGRCSLGRVAGRCLGGLGVQPLGVGYVMDYSGGLLTVGGYGFCGVHDVLVRMGAVRLGDEAAAWVNMGIGAD